MAFQPTGSVINILTDAILTRLNKVQMSMLKPGSVCLSGADSFPIYKQLPTDNSCGPRCILMVADYFEGERGRKLYAYEWSRVLEITMKNDLARDRGTSWGAMVRGLSAVGLSCKQIRGTTPELSWMALSRSLARNHPVIVNCKIPLRGESVRHYAVLIAMNEELLYFADPFPHKRVAGGSFRPVPWADFRSNRWHKGAMVWGSERWAVEITGIKMRR